MIAFVEHIRYREARFLLVGHWSQGLFLVFAFTGLAFTLVGVATDVVLHRVSIRTLGELSASGRFRILGVRALPSAPCEEQCPP
jgi:hypothetical protein